MKARQVDEDELVVDESIDAPENMSKSSLTTKLERRRRIEDLNEERRMREELDEF